VPFSYSLQDYIRYREQVGEATYIDVTRRSDPARFPAFWDHLREIVDRCGAPWVVQVWSKDPAGVLALGTETLRATMVAGTTVTAQITITGLAGTVWEPLVPTNALDHLVSLIELIGGPQHVTWRYDPIIPTIHDPARYRRLACQVAELGIRRGVINFVAPPSRYARVDRRLQAILPGWSEGMPGYDLAWQIQVATELVAIAQEVEISLSCCAEGAPLHEQVPGLGRAACGDHEWFAALSGQCPPPTTSKGSRPGCGCARYYDVGNYGYWARCHRCAYCYAG
jgi:hypothetical protein